MTGSCCFQLMAVERLMSSDVIFLEQDKMADDSKLAEDTIDPSDIKNAAKQALANVLDEEGTTYDHAKASGWIAKICDTVLNSDKLVKARKPYKFVVNAMVVRAAGAGVHVSSSCYLGPHDGYHIEEYNNAQKQIYAALTVYWCQI